MAELADALNALSVGVHVAASGPRVVDEELSDVLAHLDITPGQPAHSAAIRAAEEWAELEEQGETEKLSLKTRMTFCLRRLGTRSWKRSAFRAKSQSQTAWQMLRAWAVGG